MVLSIGSASGISPKSRCNSSLLAKLANVPRRILRRRSWRWLLLHAGHVFALRALLIARIWTALVPLLLLFGGLCEDLETLVGLLPAG
jgi:hypothetical protein